MPVDNKTSYLIRKFALKNAMDYGKADAGSVLGKVIPVAKGIPVPELKGIVDAEVSRVNGLRRKELESEYAPFADEFVQKAKEKAERTAKPSLVIDGAVKGKVVTRFPPEPGGYIQIGNVKQCLLSSEVSRLYNGKIYLYFDDTNPEKCRQEYVEEIKRDTEWLGVRFDKEYYASDNIEKVYESARKLLKGGNAYVCFCTAQQIKEGRAERKGCAHLKQKPAENLAHFEEMLEGKYEEGQAVVRLRGDMRSDNATFRDPTLLRVKKTTHYRHGDKYAVWPTYHINTPVMDHLYGITDVIRGKEYEIWDDINKKMLESLGISPPRFHYEARLRIIGNTTAKRSIRKFMKEKLISGWDDPRLLTVAALRRRGIQPAAIRDFVLRFGMSKTDSAVPMEMLLAGNKRIIDPVAKHLYFVPEPVRLTIKGAPKLEARMKLRPAGRSGYREYETAGTFYISGEDASSMEIDAHARLKDLADVVITKKGDTIEAELSGDKDGRIIQWVAASNYKKCTVTVPLPIIDENGGFIRDSLKLVSGYVESDAVKLKEREIVQFERFGYCILDDKEKLQFIFISK